MTADDILFIYDNWFMSDNIIFTYIYSIAFYCYLKKNNNKAYLIISFWPTGEKLTNYCVNNSP